MSQKDNFTGGFLIGTIVGGFVGGILGTILANKVNNSNNEEKLLIKPSKRKKLDSEESIEEARRSLEDKIAQLNTAIDDVREQLGTVENNN